MKKKIITLVAMLFSVSMMMTTMQAAEGTVKIYVSPAGDDNAAGTAEKPLKTIAAGQKAAREVIAAGLNGDVEVVIGEGTYILDETLKFDERDSGNNGFSVIYTGENYPLISGGKRIEGFEDMGNGLWRAYAPDFEFIRELYVNDVRRYRASTEKEIVGLGEYDDPNTVYTVDGFYFDKDVLPVYSNADDMTVRSGVGWKGHEWGINKIFEDPENPDRTIAVMDGWFYFQTTIPDWGHKARYDIGLRIENAIELLDCPGEYFFDKYTKELFYMPMEGEDMTTAEVYAPVLERIIKCEGDAANDKYIENLKFHGLRVAHSSMNFPEYMGYAPGQAQSLHISDRTQVADRGTEGYVTGAVEIAGVKNGEIENCVFFGTGGAAVRLLYSIDGFKFNGNVIYDTNEGGVVVGDASFQTTPEEAKPEPENYRHNMLRYVSKISASGQGAFGDYVFLALPNVEGAWVPINDVNEGEKSWYSLEFDEPVTVDEIVVKTLNTPEDVPQKRNFEILLSNDKDFKNSKVVYRQGNQSYGGDNVSVKVNDPEKYKYFMIRKTEVEAFSLDSLEVLTYDIPYREITIPVNVTISNNYITRVGNYFYAGTAIHAYFASDLTVEHNDVYLTPYTAISAGWGWSPNANSMRRNKFLNNRMDSFNIEIQDGGAIYVLSRQWESVMEGNYAVNQYGPFGAYYFDEGSSEWTLNNNVAENCTNSIFNWNPTSNSNIHAKNTYADVSYFNNSGRASTVEAINIYPMGNRTPEAQEIYENAGLKPEYEYLKDLVPFNKPYYGNEPIDMFNSIYGHYGTTEHDYTDGKMKIAQTLMRETECGDLPGQYGAYDRLVLSERIAELGIGDRVADSTPRGTAERSMRMEAASAAYSKTLNRLSYEDTLAVAKKLAETTEIGTGVGMATKEAKEELAKVAAAIEADETKTEYAKVYALEAAICEFDATVAKTDILGIKIKGLDSRPKIDKENHIIEIAVPKGMDKSKIIAEVVASANCTVYPDFTQGVDFTYPVKAAVKNGEFVQEWIVELVTDEETGWWNWYDEKIEVNGNTVNFDEAEKIYMNKSEKTNSVNVKIKNIKLDNLYRTRILFDCTKAQLSEDSLDEDTSYFALDIYKDNICLTQVKGGKQNILYGRRESESRVLKNMLKTSDYITEGEDVDISINTQKTGEKVKVEVKINGNNVINALCSSNNPDATGFWGIGSQYKPMEIVCQ